MPAIPLQHDDDFYPSSDGKPMAESDLHQREMLDLIAALRDRYRSAPDIYVAGNNLLYYVRGDRGAVVSPDVYMVKGVPKGLRKSYKLWEEGVGPCFVIEVTSESTRDDDLRRKLDLYERLGVEEYFLHDPLGDYLSPSLQGYRLAGGPGGKYRTIVPERDGSLTAARPTCGCGGRARAYGWWTLPAVRRCPLSRRAWRRPGGSPPRTTACGASWSRCGPARSKAEVPSA